ncbi:DUF4843 domain-containing protein [Deminuibacter soli]|uniref:DUF4843 domain-containing protein n=1 Tax=Deminuibacter soli TaxID=2291815 RepID=A0A3E1NK54_9BACT|nr:DUF4843 domain-containing protein [Deminuibacter soli]RFM28204.1 DUF4843 domain-containing protein [Deminuibacter soli]
MRKKLYFALLAVGITASCKKAVELTYNSPDNIHFNFDQKQADSVLFTFAYTPNLSADTISLPVQLSGIRADHDRRFIIRVDKDSTTAIENLHYKPFDSSYVLPANTGTVFVNFVIYNNDSLLQQRSVSIRFRLYPTADLGTNLPYKLISNKVVFSNKLEEPEWWPMWMGDYYSQVKHELFIVVTGLAELSTNPQEAPKNQYLASLETDFLRDPRPWLKKHPDYVLELQPDGNYRFYNIHTPKNTVLYRLKPESGRYFFVDENGNDIS